MIESFSIASTTVGNTSGLGREIFNKNKEDEIRSNVRCFKVSLTEAVVSDFDASVHTTTACSPNLLNF